MIEYSVSNMLFVLLLILDLVMEVLYHCLHFATFVNIMP